MEEDSLKLLLRRAGALLARRAHSRGEMRDKLLRRAQADDVDRAIARLEALGLLNDLDYAYNFATHRIRVDQWGPVRVRSALHRRKIAPDLIESALERVHSEIEVRSVAEAYLEKYLRTRGLPCSRRDIHKLFFNMRRRGFGDDMIRSLLQRKLPPASWQRFETGE